MADTSPSMKATARAALAWGTPAPWFEVRASANPRFHFDTVAGRHVVLCFFGSAADPISRHELDVGGQTVTVHDPGHKRRRDEEIRDESLRRACMVRIHDRLVPEVRKAFQFQATRIERYLVACYDADSGGHFRPHRDNTTKGTA